MLSWLCRLIDQRLVVVMDQSRRRAREGEDEPDAAGARRQRQTTAEVGEEVVEALANGVGEDEPWQHPPGVFELPWLKCRGGLGLGSGGGWELRDVFFRSLVDGRAATIAIPGDCLTTPPSMIFDDVEAWLAGGDGSVEPLWRSVAEGPKPAA